MAEHYFTSSPTSTQTRQAVPVDVWGAHLDLESASGVFSAGRLDKGTAVLFREASPSADACTLLDLGCGYGVIACALAAALPGARVWAVDVNERALQLARDNAARLGFGERVRPVLPEQVPDDVRFDEIWANPPVRVGKATLHDLLDSWLGRLAPGGRAVLVVGKNLGADSLQRWLIGQGRRCERLGSAKGFRVLEVRDGNVPG